MFNKENLKLFCFSLIIASLIALLASWFVKVSFLKAFGISIIAMLLNGIIMNKEDNEPGGFNNPKSK